MNGKNPLIITYKMIAILTLLLAPLAAIAMVVEAEDGQLFGSMAIGADSNASGGEYLDAINGRNYSDALNTAHRAEYSFNVTQAGTYKIVGNVHATNNGSDSFWVQVDGLPSAGYKWAVERNTIYSADDVNSASPRADPVVVPLVAGVHTVTIFVREKLTRLDKLELVLLEASSLPVVETPTISPNGGGFTSSVDVTLATNTAGAVLYYTADGSEPTTQSAQYGGPFTLAEDTTVMAKGFLGGYDPSITSSADFIVMPAAATGLLFEAEDGQLFGSVAIGADSGASGGEYVGAPEGSGAHLLNSGNRADYTFTTTQAGDYKIVANVYSPNSGSDSFFVTIDGEPSVGYLWDTLRNTTYSEDEVADRGDRGVTIFGLTQGAHTVSFHVRDDGTRLDKFEIVLVAATGGGNTAPVLSTIADQGEFSGDSVNLSVSASDADNDTLSFSARGLPPQLGIDSGTGQMTGSLTVAGTYSVTITVADGNGGTDSKTFVWSVLPSAGSGFSAFDNVPVLPRQMNFPWFADAMAQFTPAQPDDPMDWQDAYNNTPSSSRVIVANCNELQAALDNANPGGMILIQSGQYNGCNVEFKRSGTADQPIILTSEAKALGQSGDVTFSGGARFGLFPRGASYYIIGGLRFTNQSDLVFELENGSGTRANPVYRNGSTDIRFTDNHFEGIGVNRGSGEGVIIVGVRSHRIRIDHSSFISNYNHIRYVHSGNAGSLVSTSKDGRVDHNYFGPAATSGFRSDVSYEIGAIQTCCGTVQESSDPLTLTFEYNVVEHPNTPHTDPEALEIKTNEFVTRHNIIWGDNDAVIGVRASYNSTVDSNYLVGTGISIHGSNNSIVDNYIDGHVEGRRVNLKQGIFLSRWGRRQPSNCTTLPITANNEILGNTVINTSQFGLRIGDCSFGACRPITDSLIANNRIESSVGRLLHFNTRNEPERTDLCSGESQGSPGNDGGRNTGIVFDGNMFYPRGSASTGSAFGLDMNSICLGGNC